MRLMSSVTRTDNRLVHTILSDIFMICIRNQSTDTCTNTIHIAAVITTTLNMPLFRLFKNIAQICSEVRNTQLKSFKVHVTQQHRNKQNVIVFRFEQKQYSVH